MNLSHVINLVPPGLRKQIRVFIDDQKVKDYQPFLAYEVVVISPALRSDLSTAHYVFDASLDIYIKGQITI